MRNGRRSGYPLQVHHRTRDEKQLREPEENLCRRGAIGPEKDPAMVAAGLMAIVNGFGSSVLGGQHTGKAALEVLCHHLDELSGPATPASDSS